MREQPRDTGGARRGEQRRQNQPQREHAAQHLDREQRPAERHAIGRRHAGSGAAGHQQAALLVRQSRAVRQRVGDDGSGLLGRAFAAQRGAHAHDDHRQRAVPSVRSAGMRPAKSVMASVMSMLLPPASRRRSICPAPVSVPAAAE